jgi:hypothetical protein
MTEEPATLEFGFGEVIRVASDMLAYLALEDKTKILSFTPALVENFGGKGFKELQIAQGSIVRVSWVPEKGVVDAIVPLRGAPFRSTRATKNDYSDLPRPSIRDPSTRSSQKILRPEAKPKANVVVRRAIKPETRSFGKVLDCTPLQPGDLLLSHDLIPDAVSNLIAKIQIDGGYHHSDARWTHAAMYLGDGENVVEATFETLFSGGSVRITSVDDYCQGSHTLRFRRSRYVQGSEDGWRLVVRALSRLRQPYDFLQAARLWWDVAVRKSGFYDGRNRRTTSEAVICSTLYAEAYNEVTRRTLGEIGGVCVPAWLSIDDEFEDVEVNWAKLDVPN